MLTPKHIKKIFIMSQAADPSPPLGTILGNLGVNTSQFCTIFNQYTKNLSSYFLLCVSISIYENRTTSFNCYLPTTSYIISLLKYEVVVKQFVNNRFINKSIICVDINELIKLAKLKMPTVSIKKSILVLIGTVKAHGYVISLKNNKEVDS